MILASADGQYIGLKWVTPLPVLELAQVVG